MLIQKLRMIDEDGGTAVPQTMSMKQKCATGGVIALTVTALVLTALVLLAKQGHLGSFGNYITEKAIPYLTSAWQNIMTFLKTNTDGVILAGTIACCLTSGGLLFYIGRRLTVKETFITVANLQED